MVFYRKYRPQTLADIDKEEVRRRLSFILSSSRGIPHAFLFCGPKGTGKTSAARILAKAVNCLKRTSEVKEVEPCNRCSQCLSITNGANLDVLEIDAASNRGIDEIRELRDKIRLAPISSRYKVYIIDEVHMLTTEAFNCLLKTLEEPPAHAIFILATTESHKLPETILSRCLRFDFGRAEKEEIIRALQRTVLGEKIKLPAEVLEMIAASSDGSFRDGQKILEEIAVLGLKTEEEVSKFLGRNIDSQVKKLLINLFKKNTKEALETLLLVYKEGANIKNLNEQVLETLHHLLLEKYGVKTAQNLSEGVNITSFELRQLIEIFSKAYQELKAAAIATLPLELAIIEWGEKKEGENV